MQFSCDSCKTVLQIADEKVRGKRLVVRCKRCGAKITISDPAYAGAAVGRSNPAAPVSRPAPAARPPQRPAPAQPAPQRRESDPDSTRAMETAVLERALEASKREAETVAPPEAPADAAVWFAMIAGKQAGPLTRADLVLRAAQGSVGQRTYLWKEGMDSWQRAKDVPEVADLFPTTSAASAPAAVGVAASVPPRAPPAAKQEEPPPQSAQTAAAAGAGMPRHEQVRKELFPTGEHPIQNATDLARWASEELGKHKPVAPEPEPPARHSPTLLARAVGDSAPSTHLWLAVAIGAVIALVIALWAWLGTANGAPVAQRRSDGSDAPLAQGGLTAEQVRARIDSTKVLLQDCVDEALQRDPSLRVGTLHLAAAIAPDGSVLEARIDKPAVDSSPLGACLKGVARRIVFPAFRGESFEVDIPVVVTAGEHE